MKEVLRKEKRNNFEAWVATIDERLTDWFSKLDPEYETLFDFSIDSLDEIEKYLFSRYELSDLSDSRNKYDIDAAASYIMKVFSIHWENHKYLIELNDERNILFNRPAIITDPCIGMAFSPYQIIPSTLNLKRVGGFRKILESKKKQYIEKYGSSVNQEA